MNKAYLLITLSVIWFFGSGQSGAQEQTPFVKLQFVSFPRASKSNSVQLYLGDGKALDILMPTNNLSKIYKVPSQDVWRIGIMNTDHEGSPVFIEYGKTKSKESVQQVILIQRKGKKNSDGLSLSALSSQQFSEGKCLISNATKMRIGGTIGTESFSLVPDRHTIIKLNSNKQINGKGIAHSKFFYQTKTLDNKNISAAFHQSNWRVNDRVRVIVFFYQDVSTKQIRSHTIRNYR